MRRANMDSGFLICWALNMFLNWEVGALAFILWVAHIWFDLSWYPAAAALSIWILGALAITSIFAWASSGGSKLKENSEFKNINPYSRRNFPM